MKSIDVLIRQVNALPRRRHTRTLTEWQLSRARGPAITRVRQLDEALAMAATILAGSSGRIYVQRAIGRPEQYEPSPHGIGTSREAAPEDGIKLA
jgi:hypothetical protein